MDDYFDICNCFQTTFVLKHLAGLEQKPALVLKVDDDVFVNADHFVDEILGKSLPSALQSQG